MARDITANGLRCTKRSKIGSSNMPDLLTWSSYPVTGLHLSERLVHLGRAGDQGHLLSFTFSAAEHDFVLARLGQVADTLGDQVVLPGDLKPFPLALQHLMAIDA